MILEQLMEKKDLLAYISARMVVLRTEKTRAARIVNKERREVAIRQIQGRFMEMGYLRKLLMENKVKTMSKKFWRDASKRSALQGTLK